MSKVIVDEAQRFEIHAHLSSDLQNSYDGFEKKLAVIVLLCLSPVGFYMVPQRQGACIALVNASVRIVGHLRRHEIVIYASLRLRAETIGEGNVKNHTEPRLG